MEEDDLEALARSVYNALAQQPAGTILAVWRNGSFTREGFGFRWHQAEGKMIEPVVTFPSKSAISYRELRKRLTDAFRIAGLVPPEGE
jgi:hypothetical protein